MTAPYRNILTALDPESPSDAPLIAGWRLALEQSATLRIAAAVRPALVSAKGFFNPQLVDRQSVLRDAREAVELRTRAIIGDTVPIDVMVGAPGEVVATIAEKRSCDLIVLGARPRSGTEHVFGTTSTDVLRHADGIDVYACHRPDPENPTDITIIAIDGSDATDDVLAGSVRFLEPAHGDHRKTHVICVAPGNRAAKIVDRCRSYLKTSPWSDLDVRAEEGDVTDSLEAAIRELECDLLIIGSGENLGIGWSLGSTTNEVLHEVSCDVLVIRP
ncbi:MAG: universal stress protein [Pseudomonadales bacterium]